VEYESAIDLIRLLWDLLVLPCQLGLLKGAPALGLDRRRGWLGSPRGEASLLATPVGVRHVLRSFNVARRYRQRASPTKPIK
jgi:hypothetical protein